MNHQFAAYLPIDRLHSLVKGTQISDRVQGAALFADISGFTPLTGALATELGRQRGAEAVLDTINPIYEALVGAVHSYGGSVIGFAGDSITCWLEGDDGWRAATCGMEMQRIMGRLAAVTTPGGAQVQLSIKVGIAAGAARRFLAGDPHIHNFEALAGKTLERMAAAEGQAQKGEVILSREVIEALCERAAVVEWRPINDPQLGEFALLDPKGFQKPLGSFGWPELPPGALSDEQLRPWIDAPVYARLKSGAAYLAELRPVASLFLKFSGIDYDGDDRAGEKLDAFVRWVQSALARYDGVMTQLTIGDKGSNILAVFGAPIAHDDDAARAAAAALDLCPQPESMDFVRSVQVGISQGLAWAGAVGGRLRCIYSVMGDEVNMAARLMGKAEAGQTLVNQMVVDATRQRFQYRSLGPIQVKGRTEPLPVSELVCRNEAAGQALAALFHTPLVGRESYLETMSGCLEAAGQGVGQALRLEGPAGVGKSHLAAVFTAMAVERGWQAAAGLCQSTTQDTPYAPWRQIMLALLGLAGGDAAALSAQVAAALAQANPDWAPRLPLLGDLLGLPFAETPVTAALEPKQRREALFALLIEILQTWAAQRPLLLVLEDVHWLDEASAGLTVAVVRALSASTALVLLVQRPPLEGQAILPEIDALSCYRHIELGDLSTDGVAALARNRLEAPLSLLGLQLALALAHGNPFFTEELLDALREAGYLVFDGAEWGLSQPALDALIDGRCLVKVEGEWQMVEDPPLGNVALDIPDTVQGTVLARLDRLPETHKLALKVASVIGRTFSLELLHGVHPEAPAREALQAQIDTLGGRDFVRLERPGADPVYIFKHNTTQEVAYGTLLFAQRQALHGRVGEWYEAKYNDRLLPELTLDAPLAAHYPLLVHHWRQAENPERERVYAGLAGEQAAKKFANESAVRYYSRALELAPAEDYGGRWKLLLGREDVNDVMGKREAQLQDLAQLEEISSGLGDERMQCRLLLRRVRHATYTSALDIALDMIQSAAVITDRLQDAHLQADVQQSWGRILFVHSEYSEALKHLSRALVLAQIVGDRLQEARCYLYTGLVYKELLNDLVALENFEKGLQVYRTINYLDGEIGCLMNIGATNHDIGNYVIAREYYEQARKLSQRSGLRFAESYALGFLGNDAFDLGDYEGAEKYHRQALQVAQEIGNRQRYSISQDTLSLVYTIRGDYQAAQDCARQALAIQQAVGNQQGQGYTLNHLGLALAGAGEHRAAQDAFEQALQIRIKLEQHTLMLDDRAGLARLAQKTGDMAGAQTQVEAILTLIAQHGIAGCEFPIWVYLTCYHVLHAAGDLERAHNALQAGYDLLQQRAGQIQDQTLRRQFIEKVPYNQELLRQLE